MIHWAPNGGDEAACGEPGALMLSVTMSRPNCTLCRELIGVEIDSLKYIEPDEEVTPEFLPLGAQASLLSGCIETPKDLRPRQAQS